MASRRWVFVVLLCSVGAGVAAAGAASDGGGRHRVTPPLGTFASVRRLGSGRSLEARLSGNGEWLLVSQGIARVSGDLYLARVGATGLRLVGRGGEAEGVSDDGKLIADKCAELTICVERVGSRTVRRIALPCLGRAQAETGVADAEVYVVANVRSMLVRCEVPHVVSTKLVQIERKLTRTTTIATGLEPEAVSSDGSTAILTGSSEHGSGSIYLYHDGRVQQLAGLTGFYGMSSNGRFVVAGGAATQSVVCGERCTRNVPEPVVIDLQTGQRHELRLVGHFVEGSGKWSVADDGQTMVYPEIRGITTYQALQLTNTETGAQTALAASPSGFTQFGMSAGGRTFFYVVSGQRRNGRPSALYVVTTKPSPRAP